ncbi:Zn-dependent hydrolase, partial [Klebsiella pneumoniae]
MSHYLQINGQRLIDSLYALGEHGALDRGGVGNTEKNPQKKKNKEFVFAP